MYFWWGWLRRETGARSASEPQALGTEENEWLVTTVLQNRKGRTDSNLWSGHIHPQSLEVTTVESFLCLFQRFFISWLICIKKCF
ncbi:guanine nucleotide-binding protein G(I)/G(S)/G(O) subunit gamma-2 isoform X1 [Pongo abelii]|uniref:guanine nucleotide-binding protein G(I)/G(S)/G(O) subunit gamma-2 isoform X1 n=1 Tax=Pongo abelii TaxID=9601 RepID=UPI003005945B